MRTTSKLVLGFTAWALLQAHPVEAALITFNSEAAFDAAAPGLPTETFNAGLVAPSSVTTCTGPISSAAASNCFAAGALLPGVTYDGTSATADLVLLGANFPIVGNTSTVLGANLFADTTNVTFTSTVNAVGLDVFRGSASTAGVVQISIFDPANAPLGTFLVGTPTTGPAFFGVISTSDLIGRINVASLANGGELIDNVSFGAAAAVPEPTSMLLLATGLLGAGVRIWGQKRT